MADFKSKVKYAFDGDPSVTLRSATDGAETATASETGIALNALTAAYWDGNEIPEESMTAVVTVDALDSGDADETYVLTLEVDSVLAFSDSPVTVASLTVSSTGVYSMNIDADTIKALDGNAAFIRIKATLGGTTPSITYGSWLVKTI